ncbi:MAG TPA: HAMP domain-containing sensor histidine kinase [Chitinophagaceae bacterium]|nr:HAMP domain-containing sensor histidine kinase [Chitinophagaceae bacterium]
MIRQLINWRTGITLVAVAIITGTVFYSNFLAKKIAAEERKKVNVWVQSLKTRATTTEPSALDLTNIITSENTDIPIIETDENDRPLGLGLNLDTVKIKSDTNFLRKKVLEFKNQHEPIIVEVNKEPLIVNKYYYGNSALLKQVRYYPLVQLLIVALFISIILYAISVRNKSTQNQVWLGMAKETAHQLGTPLSSLQGWIEVLKEKHADTSIPIEMEKDIDRLKLISDRFSKIGSSPKLEEKNIVVQINNMVAYIKRRSTDKVSFNVDTGGAEIVVAKISSSLFDWVIENLLKNALDAMEGKGSINIKIRKETSNTIIDISDTGKGISKKNLSKVFKPGFTTKKRGWGLGLSLSKRIIEQYHKGILIVKHSEQGKGTTFRIVLKKSPL